MSTLMGVSQDAASLEQRAAMLERQLEAERAAAAERDQRLSLTMQAFQGLVRLTDPDAVMDQLLAAVAAFSGAQQVELLVRPEADLPWQLITRELSGETRRIYQSQQMTGSLTAQALAEGRMQRAERDDHPADQEVAVPLVARQETIGVMTLRFAANPPVDAGMLQNLQLIADLAADRIDHVRQFADFEFQIRTLRHLQSLSMAASPSETLTITARTVLTTACDMIGTGDAALYRLQMDLDQIQKIAATSSSGLFTEEGAASITPLLLRAARMNELRADLVSGIPTVALAMRATGSNRYVLLLGLEPGRRIRQREIAALTLLGGQAASHLENSMLFEQVRAGANRIRAILNSTRDGVVLLDREGRFLECNPAAERLIGVEKDEVIGQHIVTVLTSMLDVEELTGLGYSRAELTTLARQLRLESQRVTRREFVRQTVTRPVYIEEIGGPVRSDSGEIIGRLLVFRDVSEQHRLAEFRDEITRMMVHDLRGPLWAVQASIRLALEDLPPDQAEVTRRTLRVAEQSTTDLMAIVDSMLEIGKLETDELQLQRTVVHARLLVDAAVQSVGMTLAQANITCEVTEQQDDTTLILVDEPIVRRVLINLLDNAARFARQNGQIRVTLERRSADVRISIADDGPGIPAADRDRVFQRFQQVQANVPQRGSRGSGLGLTFCRLAVEAHGGQIWVEPRSPLPGACIALTLPLAAASPVAS
jgi:PAS domain S-box-containing protein